MGRRWQLITSCPQRTEGGRRETTCNGGIDIVTRRKQPERLVAQVRMTHATLLRSRMNGNVHVGCCSRVEVATPRLRQRPEGEGRETVQTTQGTRKLYTMNVVESWRNGRHHHCPSLVSRVR